MIRVFIGYDGAEPAAFTVCAHSLLARSSKPLSISPLKLSQLGGVLTRPRHALQSTEFSFSRFLVPWLCDYQGWALFIDGDMVVLDDIVSLWALRDPSYAVMVVKQQHCPINARKFLNQPQTAYPRKNWSSVILFNNARCRALNPDYVNQAGGLDLHQFAWLDGEQRIGALPARWNYLARASQGAAVAQPDPDLDTPVTAEPPAIVHYTEGGPYFAEYRGCEYAEQWFQERDAALFARQDESAKTAP